MPVTSRDASFWDLGGHSLRLFTLATRIRDQLGVQLKLRELFQHPRLRDLADLIDRTSSGTGTPAPAPQRQEVPAADFQQRVWAALREIPYGETCSYAELAVAIGQPTAVRAVGLANGKNPVSIVVPCHRVVGTNGSLTGYGGGTDRKRALLELEGALVVRGEPALFGT